MSEIIYRQNGLPVFQNKVYRVRDDALNAVLGDVELVQCQSSGLVFNRLFDPNSLDYDEDYQNDQACSPAFRQHLDAVLRRVIHHFGDSRCGVEIGCGKGYFLSMLQQAGATVTGFDPAYQGNNPNVRKAYYQGSLHRENPDYIILRHVLEHIPSPWDFLEKLATECKSGCGIYIEVPCFDWIVANHAFYDVFYEHCNYFTLDVLNSAFGKVMESGHFFGDQYLYVFADLSSFHRPDGGHVRKHTAMNLQGSLSGILTRRVARGATYVWGAGAKGITFTNLLFLNDIQVTALIDINPAKQGRFIGLSGIKIKSPEDAGAGLKNANVIVMNPVYASEIAGAISHFNPNLISVA